MLEPLGALEKADLLFWINQLNESSSMKMDETCIIYINGN